MKKFGAFKAAQLALTFAFAVSIFATAQFSTITEAQANPARLAAIKRVEGLHERKNRKAIQSMVERWSWWNYQERKKRSVQGVPV